MQYEKVLEQLKSLANPEVTAGMAKYGIITKGINYGISIPDLRALAKEIGRDHSLAQKLWATDSRETRILASMIDDPKMVTGEQIEEWVKDFDNWEVCDQCCMNLFRRTEFAYRKCVEWSSREEEFVKRAGFVLMACLAVSDKKADDEQFEQFFSIIEREAGDSRSFVRKSVNWALRQIGKRNLSLNDKAVEVAREMQQMDSKSAVWIASDAIRELTGEAVQERLRRRS